MRSRVIIHCTCITQTHMDHPSTNKHTPSVECDPVGSKSRPARGPMSLWRDAAAWMAGPLPASIGAAHRGSGCYRERLTEIARTSSVANYFIQHRKQCIPQANTNGRLTLQQDHQSINNFKKELCGYTNKNHTWHTYKHFANHASTQYAYLEAKNYVC